MRGETIAQYGEYAQHGGVVVFDTETTGLGDEDEICQIAAARYENGTLTQSLNEYSPCRRKRRKSTASAMRFSLCTDWTPVLNPHTCH